MRVVLVLLSLVALASAAVRLPPIAGARPAAGGGALNPTPPKAQKDSSAPPSPKPDPKPAGPPAPVTLIPAEQMAIADGATKSWNTMSLIITSDPNTHDRFIVLAPNCPGTSPACALDEAAQRDKGLLMGGSVGKWDCITVGKTAQGAPGEVLQEFQVKFKSSADGSTKTTTFYSKGNADHVFEKICWQFHAVPFKALTTPDWGPAASKIDLPSTSSAPDADGRMYPGWETDRTADTAFCWAFEFESNLGKTTEILNYYRPPFTPNAKTFPNADQAWKEISIEDKAAILHCRKGAKRIHETRCDTLPDKAANPTIGASILEFVTQMRKIDFEHVVRCEEDCRSANAAAFPDCTDLFTAHGKPVLFFAAPHMHQEVTSPVTFEVMHERCETNWNTFSKEVKCMDAIFGAEAKSMHLHTSMRMSPNTQQTKAAAALMIFFGDILFAGKIRDDADASYMSSPSQKAVNDLFQQIDKGYMLVEAKNHADGSAWGEFKKARNALRAHLYGPYRFGFELRAGTQALSKLAGIYTALKELRPDSMGPVERVTKGSLVMVKALCTILAQRNFGPNTPVRLIQLPIPGQPTPPPAGYTINNLYNNVLEHRNVGDCATGTSCPFVKPSAGATSPRRACGAETLQKLTVPLNDIWVKGKWGRAPTPAESSQFSTARVSISAQMGQNKCTDADDGAIIPEIVGLYKKQSKFEVFLVDAI